MKTASAHGFVNQLLVYTLVMIGLSGSLGIGAVWMRYNISVTADRTKQLATRIAEVERRIAETTAAAETERDPNVLLERNAAWHLGLMPPTPQQVARIDQDPVQHLAAKRNLGLFREGAATVTIPLNFNR